jgi:hypothetical protein
MTLRDSERSPVLAVGRNAIPSYIIRKPVGAHVPRSRKPIQSGAAGFSCSTNGLRAPTARGGGSTQAARELLFNSEVLLLTDLIRILEMGIESVDSAKVCLIAVGKSAATRWTPPQRGLLCRAFHWEPSSPCPVDGRMLPDQSHPTLTSNGQATDKYRLATSGGSDG